MPLAGHILGPLLLAAQPVPTAEAQEAPTISDGIVVTAPPSASERRKQLRSMARTLIRAPRNGRPIARFFYPVCPQVIGLERADAAAIEQRIRDNATQLGLGPEAGADCTPTIRIAFMGPRAGSSDTWLDDGSAPIEHLTRAERLRVLNEQGPVRAWSKTKLRDKEGRPFVFDEGFTEIRNLDRKDYRVTNEITGAAVLIAREAAEGKTLAQLADYATMRALAGTNGAGRNVRASTILTLFTGSDAPDGLTVFDRALLSQLYGSAKNAWVRSVYKTIAARAVDMERAARDAGNTHPSKQ